MQPNLFRGKAYGANRNKVVQLIAAGLASSLVIFIMGFCLPGLDLPRVDYAALCGSLLGRPTQLAPFSGNWWLGFLIYLVAGSGLAVFAYDFLIDKRVLPNLPRAKGIIWGGLIWVLLEITLKPIAGHGIFSSASISPTPLAFASLMTCLAYGFLFECATRVPLVHALRRRQKQLDVADCHNHFPFFHHRRSP